MKKLLITAVLVLSSQAALAFDLSPDPMGGLRASSLSLSPQMGTPMDSQLMSKGLMTGGTVDQWQDSSLLNNIGSSRPGAAKDAFDFYATDGLSRGTPIMPMSPVQLQMGL